MTDTTIDSPILLRDSPDSSRNFRVRIWMARKILHVSPEPQSTMATSLSIQDQARDLKGRIDILADHHKLSREDSAILEACLMDIMPFMVTRDGGLDPGAVANSDETREASIKIANVTTKVATIEDKFQESHLEKRATNWITVAALLVLLVLVITNMVPGRSQFQWPRGWFTNQFTIGFALVGAIINILFTHIYKVREQDWKHNYRSSYATRLLTAVAYSAILVQFSVFYLRLESDNGLCRRLLGHCVQPGGEIILVTSFFIGLFITRINSLLRGYMGVESQRRREERLSLLRKQYEDLLDGIKGFPQTTPPQPRDVSPEMLRKLLTLIQREETDRAEREYLEIVLNSLPEQSSGQQGDSEHKNTNSAQPEEQNQ